MCSSDLALLAYDGVAVVVTHDRAFLDRVCNAVLAFEGEGRVVRYASRQQHLAALARAEPVKEAEKAKEPEKPREVPKETGRRKLSWKEQREFEELPARIDALEAEQAALGTRLADPAIYRDGTDTAALSRRLGAIPAEIEAAFTRWAELGERA